MREYRSFWKQQGYFRTGGSTGAFGGPVSGTTVTASSQFLAADGNANLPGYAWTSEPSSGFYRSGAGTIDLSILTADTFRWSASAFFPIANGTISLGGSANRFNQVWANIFMTQPTNTQVGATYVVAASDTSVIANRAGTVTLTLPSASTFSGRFLIIRTIQAQLVVSDASNVVPLIGGAAGTAILAATAGKFAFLHSDGTNWQTMMAN